MKELKIYILGILGIFFTTSGIAQQDAQYTQYMYNTISVNPAYAGSRGFLSAMGMHRSQWVGLEGAPRTQTLTVNTPVKGNNRIGLGFSVVNDELGPVDETYINVDFAYTLYTSETGRFSLGLKAGFNLLNIDLESLLLLNENDNIFQTNVDKKISPNIGLGVYYHTDKFYLGLSAPNILETAYFNESSTVVNGGFANFVAQEKVNFYLITGGIIKLSDNVRFKPALLTKLVLGTPLQVDISTNFLLYDRLTLGLAYRWDAAVSAMAGFQVTDAMMIGFGYDKETTELGNTQFNDGSYEVMLRFELFKKYDKMLTPRFF